MASPACISQCSSSTMAAAVGLRVQHGSSSSSSRRRSQRQPRGRHHVVIAVAGVPEPGFYGGPPLDTKIRKSWGGKEEDPLESGDYIWNKDWKKTIDSEMAAATRAAEEERGRRAENDSASNSGGFLSVGRSLALDSMDVDLSAELAKPSKATLARQVAAARQGGMQPPSSASSESPKVRWRFAPTDAEQKKWDAGSKFKSDGTFSSQPKLQLDPAEVAAREAKAFEELKTGLVLTTVALSVVFSSTAYFLYSPEVAASYAFGSVGAVVYLRMLSQSVEGLGANSAEGAVRGAVGQPRLLVPVVLVMAFNRWNAVLVPEYDLIQLQLIPILVGFFTYKAATLMQTMVEIAKPLLPKEEN